MTRVALAVFLFANLAVAHPMGNLSINHYARIVPGPKRVDVTYVLDLAEIPTFELTQTWNTAAGTPKAELDRKAAAQAREWMANLVFRIHGKAIAPAMDSTSLTIIDGAGNLPVFRIASTLHFETAGGRLEYEDGNFTTRAGWREIVVQAANGVEIQGSSASSNDISQALTSYPQDPTKAPPQNMKAWVEWKTAPVVTSRIAPVVMQETRGVRPAEAEAMGTVKRNDSISQILRMPRIPWNVMALLLCLAFWFGALHALEPGHGKTMVTAYLVGEKGTARHAVLLGSMVTFTHTISVFILGLATMFLSRYVMPDRISKWLGILSGLSIVWIGGMMLWLRAKALTRKRSRDNLHLRSGHRHHPDGHTHEARQGDLSVGSLMALGASGGLVPCPSALILLLSAISIGRAGLGVILLVMFSLGLALVLTCTGLAVLYAKKLLPENRRRNSLVFRYVPVASAAAVLIIGALMTGVSLGWG